MTLLERANKINLTLARLSLRAIIPADVREALADLALLLVDLARRVESLEAAAGRLHQKTSTLESLHAALQRQNDDG